MMSDVDDKGHFAEKLEHLFQTKTKENGSQYSEVEIEVATANAGERVTHTYIFRLRKGKARNPSYEKIKALANFFDVHPSYFFDEPPVSNSELISDLDLRGIMMRAEQIDPKQISDDEARVLMQDMLGAIQQVRERFEQDS